MAKNYSFAEAVQVLLENEDTAAIADIGRRYPLLAVKIARVAVKAGEEFGDLMQFMPENLSANKINGAIKKALEDAGDVEDDDEDVDAEDDGDEDDVPAPKAKKAPAKAAAKGKKAEADASGDTDYDNWNNAKMYKLLGELGLRKDCKDKFGDLSHDSMLKYLKKYVADGKPVEDAEDDGEDGAEEQDYSGMKAIDLYKLCKERKIKAEQKKPAKYYIDLLKAADAEAAETEDEAEDDEEWDDEEEAAPAPKKAAKGGSKPAAKSKKPAKEADDEEDWEI
jgi:hypothetical protein